MSIHIHIHKHAYTHSKPTHIHMKLHSEKYIQFKRSKKVMRKKQSWLNFSRLYFISTTWNVLLWFYIPIMPSFQWSLNWDRNNLFMPLICFCLDVSFNWSKWGRKSSNITQNTLKFTLKTIFIFLSLSSRYSWYVLFTFSLLFTA